MKPQAIGLIGIAMLLCAPLLINSQSAPYAITAGKAYKFEKISDGVYYATATGSMVTGSNNVVIGSSDLMIVDTGTSPAAARAFIEDIKLIMSKPVRYVVNTHFHYDHTDGNQVYAGKADMTVNSVQT